jgi:hypothetical protein
MTNQKKPYNHLCGFALVIGLIFISCSLSLGVSESPATGEPGNIPSGAQKLAALPAQPAPQLAEVSQPFDKWQLWAGGTQLRGANIYQRQVFLDLDGTKFFGPGPFGPPYTQEDFDRLAALGANYVNLSIAGLYTVKPPYRPDQAAVANLDRLLAMAAKTHLFAVISFRSGPGRSEFSILRGGAGEWFDESLLVESVWTDPAARLAWADMWRFTAGRYRGNPVVVGYDLMCEPNSDDILGVWNPAEFLDQYGGTGYDWTAWYPRIIAAIRSVDADTPILVSTLGYGNSAWLPYMQLSEDTHLVYTFHQYSPLKYTHQKVGVDKVTTYPGRVDTDNDDQDEEFDFYWLEDLFAVPRHWMAMNDRPLAVNEFGAVRWAPEAADYLWNEMDVFEQNGWNYAVWMWYPSWKPLAEGDNAFNFRLGPEVDNLTDVKSSELLDALKNFWARNTVKP